MEKGAAYYSRLKQIGYIQAFKSIFIGLLAAYIFIGLTNGPFWITDLDFTFNLIFATVLLFTAGYFLGGLAGKLIVLRGYPFALTGVVSAFLIVWTATFLGSLVGFIDEGLSEGFQLSESIKDYILKPLYLVSFWGFFPITILGIWFGWSVRRKGRKLQIVNG